MLDGRPLRHVIAALAYEAEHSVRTEAVDLREIGTEHRVERGTHIESGLVPRLRVPDRREGCSGRRTLLVERFQHGLDFAVALGDLELVKVPRLHRLL